MDAKQLSRRALLKGLGLAGAGSLAGVGLVARAGARTASVRYSQAFCAGGCVRYPQTTQGPYYFNANQVRYDITEGKPGVPLRLGVTVVDLNACAPIPDALVDVWHCDALGCYSGYNQPGCNTVGQDFLRGIQPANAAGYAELLSIFPGWYQGRATHIHFKVHLNNNTYVTGQWYFPQALVNQIYTTEPPYTQRGLNPTTNDEDGIFNSVPDPEQQIMTMTPDGDGYLATITVAIDGYSVAVVPSVEPLDPPIVLPPGGGAVRYRTSLRNTTGQSQTVDAWVVAYLPDGSEYGVIAGPRRVTIGPNGTVGPTLLSQTVPAQAPAGVYTVQVRVGTYPGTVLTSDSFTFEKSAAAQDGPEASATAPSGTLSVSPNPFRMRATVQFTLDGAGPVRLAVYDLLGRQVALLAEGEHQAGPHEVAFDARGLPAGVYVVRGFGGVLTAAQRVTVLR